MLDLLCVYVCVYVCLCIHLMPADSEGENGIRVMNMEKHCDWEGVICCVSHQLFLVKRSQQSHPTLLQGHIIQPLIHLPHPPPPRSRLFSSPPSLPLTGAPHLFLPRIISPERFLSFSINCTLCMIVNTLLGHSSLV